MEFELYQKIDTDGYWMREAKFFLQPDCYPSDRMIAEPLPDGADTAANFYKWDGAAWVVEPKPTTAADLVGVAVSHKSQTKHDQEMRRIVQELGNQDGYRITRGENLEWIVEKIPEPTLEEVKAKKTEELNSAFLAWYETGATVTSSLGFVADSDSRAMMDVAGLVTSLEAQPAETRASVEFMDADNVAHGLTLEQLKTLQVEIIQNGQAAYAQKWAYRAKIDQAQDVAAVEAIDITFVGESYAAS